MVRSGSLVLAALALAIVPACSSPPQCVIDTDCPLGQYCTNEPGGAGGSCVDRGTGGGHDTGPRPDSGPATDSGPARDTGPASDTGAARDTGAATDMGPRGDTGAAPDTGASASDTDTGA